MNYNRVVFMILTTTLICGVAFMGCPETTEMVDDVIQPPSIEIETTADPQEPATPPGDAEPGDDFSEPTTPPPGDAEPGDDLADPATPPPGDAEPGGDLSEPTAPTDAEDPTEAPSVDDSGAGGLGG